MTQKRRVVVIGLDGLEPKIVEPMLERGELPHLRALRSGGGYGRVGTTLPAQTPVAWSTFSTGTNPGGHGIFDFIRRDPTNYFPDFSLNRYEQKNKFLPPKLVNLRRGTQVWDLLAEAGVPSVVLRCPCTYPPDKMRGQMLSGMGVPDLRGGLGTATFFTEDVGATPGESEQLVHIRAESDTIRTQLLGPRHPKTRADVAHELTVHIDRGGGGVTIVSDAEPRELPVRLGEWSPWLRIRFKTGMLQATAGMVRFFLGRLDPHVELYASPVNYDPGAALLYPISSPPEYAKQLANATGPFYTTGMVEDHGGLSNGRFDEGAYLDQCNQVLAERERMVHHELDRMKEGLFYCLFDTPDRVQHMFWRFREPDHPANRGTVENEWRGVIEDHYRACDAIVGRVAAKADGETLLIVLSDHGFSSFRRGFHLNSWLHANGFLTLKNGVAPGAEAGEFFHHVDWGQTKAFALGIGSIYLNLAGREAEGTVAAGEAGPVADALVKGLTGLKDPATGAVAVRGVSTREEAYSGAFAEESPDLVVRFNEGYRASWATALGGIPDGEFEDNVKKWAGDHIIDPSLVPGVLFMNRPFHHNAPHLVDLAPTILSVFGVPKGPAMEGESLLS